MSGRRAMKRPVLAAAMFVSLVSHGLAGQERRDAWPRIDDRVRVTAATLHPAPWFARVSAMSSNTMTFTGADGTRQVLAWTAIDRLEIGRAKRSGGRSTLLGAGIGLAAAATFAAVTPCEDGVVSNCHLFGAIVLGIPATLMGAIGGFFYRGTKWVDVPIR